MPRGSAKSAGSSGERISHFNAVRLRVVGTGFLKLTLYSLQDQTYYHMADLEMAATTRISPIRLANFIDQRASLRLGTYSINDYFRVNRIIVYSRDHASEYPG